MKQMEKFITQIKLIFIVFGDVFEPNDFTRKIEISPTHTWVKGDAITSSSGLRSSSTVFKRKESAWEFSIGFIETLDFNDLSERFENQFGEKLDILKSYIEENNLELSLNVIVEIANGESPSLCLSKRLISMVNKIGAEIDFDIYVLEDE